MRKLTKTEIENKQWWANSYDIQAQNNKPIFYAGLGGGAMPIPDKEFDAKDELTSLLQMCVNDMYSPSGKIKKKTARKLMAACEKGLVNYPE